MIRFILILALIHFYKSDEVKAYSITGHTIISNIASSELDSATRMHVLAALDGKSFEQAGLWMDEVRHDHKYDFMRNWHFINIEKGQNYTDGSSDNIIFALNKVLRDFDGKNKLSSEQIKTNLLILFHLIADLHQPLHVGYGDDRGGNEMQVNFAGKGTNLHRVWDDFIIQNQNIKLDDCLGYVNQLTEDEKKRICNINLVDWMNESRSLLDDVYNFNGHVLNEEYMSRMKPVVEKLLAKAGLRLAAILKYYFKDAVNLSVIESKDTLNLTAADAINHIGENAVVCGKVFTTKFIDKPGRKPTFLNLGASYPNQLLTIVIFGADRPNFTYKPESFLIDKNVCAKGRIELYKEKPQIIVSKPDQILLQ